MRRRLLLAPIAVAHAAVFAIVAMTHTQGASRIRPAQSITVIDLPSPVAEAEAESPQPSASPAAAAAALPRASAIPSIQPPAPAAILITLAPPAPVLAGQEAAAAACDLGGAVQMALRQDGGTQQALGALPANAKSVANAVMLWDGRWIESPSAATRGALRHIRDVVLTAIARAPAECRGAVQTGPDLVFVPGPRDAVLAIGSGHWRWEDLMTSSDGLWKIIPQAGAEVVRDAAPSAPAQPHTTI